MLLLKKVRVGKNVTGWLLLSAMLLAYLLLKIPNTHFYLSDENAYFYMGKLLSEGTLPYTDFFFSHPPLQLLPFAIIFKLFGFNFVLLKSVAIVATAISCAFLYRLAKEKFSETEGLLAAALFLFAQTTFYYSSFNLGVEIATAFTLIAFYLLYNKERHMASGVLFGLAAITALYALIPAAVALLFILLRSKGDKQAFTNLIRFLSGLLLSFAVPVALLFLAFGKDFPAQVFLYHTLKSAFSAADKIAFVKEFAIKNSALLVPLILLPLAKGKAKLALPAAISASYIAFVVLFFKTVFEFYFVLIFPFLALLGAHSITALISKAKPAAKILLGVVIGALLLSYAAYFDAKPLKNYDSEYSFRSWKEVSDFVVLNSNTTDKIFGDYRIAPIVALASGRGIAANIVDNHYETILSGVVDAEELTNKLKAAKVRYVMIHENRLGIQPFWAHPEMRRFLSENCGYDEPAKRISDYPNTYYIYSCNYPTAGSKAKGTAQNI